MKRSIILFLITVLITSVATAWPRRCPKPKPVPEPPRVQVEKQEEMNHLRGGHAILGAISSLIVADLVKKQGWSPKAQIAFGIGASLVTALALESDNRNRDKAMQASALGAVSAQFLRYEF